MIFYLISGGKYICTVSMGIGIYTIMHPEVMLFIADTNNDTKYKKTCNKIYLGIKQHDIMYKVSLINVRGVLYNEEKINVCGQ